MTLIAENLSFSYRTEPVLKGITFQASEGTLLCVLGKNGAGKSTLFRCILGLLRGYDGQISIDGENAGTMSAVELAKKISYIPAESFHSFFLYRFRYGYDGNHCSSRKL